MDFSQISVESVNAQAKTDNETNESEFKDETKQEESINSDGFKYNVPKFSMDELKDLKFHEEVINVYKHKCTFELDEKNNSISFYPAPHVTQKEYGKQKWSGQLLCNSRIAAKHVNKLEGMNDWDEKIILIDSVCSFITVCCKAWTDHYPLRISPANILLLILQAVAIHVDKNSEQLRSKYVRFESGKKELTLYRGKDTDNWIMGSRTNDWSGVIKEFCQQIDKNTVPDTVEVMQSDFSCSTMTDKISNKVTIMDICNNYFAYHGYSGVCCGFPKITLDGSKADWIKLRAKCEKILTEKVRPKFGEKWKLSLLPVLDRFIAVYDGNIDCIFWNSMIKKTDYQHAMGSMPAIPEQYWGWINVFFPYVQYTYQAGFYENDYCFEAYDMKQRYVRMSWGQQIYSTGARGGLTDFGCGGHKCSQYPTGLSSAAVKWADLEIGKDYKLKFYSGFMGYKQCPKTLELSPVVSWFIGHSKQ